MAALGRTLLLLEAILADRTNTSVAAIAARIGLPRATAHRQVTTLLKEGLLRRLDTGQIVAGPRLFALVQAVNHQQILVAVAAPVLHRVAQQLHCVAQLGTLENDMVTYHLKTGKRAGDLFTRVGQQLEAYCTGVGKVLLAHLTEPAREHYLAAGPFPALTKKTITDPASLRAELTRVRALGYACDNEEIVDGLVCYAVPLRQSDGEVVAAISVSILAFEQKTDYFDRHIVKIVTNSAREIERALGNNSTALQVNVRY